MEKLILLYFGTIFLAWLSQTYYPVKVHELTYDRHFIQRKLDLFCIVIIAWLICFSFLRTSYNDTANYISFWNNAAPINEFIANGGLTDLTGNPLSLFWESFSHEISDNYHVYFLLPAFLNNFIVIKLLKRYSVDFPFSLLVFFSIGTYIMYVAAMKQSVAMFFLLLAIPYAEKKKYIQFYILVFVAILFHTHAFMFAIIPFLFGKPWNKLTWFLLAATVFGMATYDYTFGTFMQFAQSIGALVAEIELFDGHQINVIRIIIYWIPVIISFIFRDRLFTYSSRIENLFVNMSIVSAFILTIGLVQGANLYARMAAYFELATAISLPWMLKKLFEHKSYKTITVIASSCYFVYFLYEFGVSKSFGQQYRAISLLDFFKELIF